MIELLRQAWHLSPDERLTQLVMNISDTHHDCGPVFYMEDDSLEQKLNGFITARRRIKP